VSGYNNYNNQNNNYYQSQPYGNYSFSDYRRINGLEIIVIVLSIISLIGVFSWGLLGKNTENRDKQREKDINQIIIALDDFYKNSSTIPSQRAYPISNCSESANEVDFEFTLKRYLTGQVLEKDSHVYIQPVNYPSDRSGQYSDTFGERKVGYRCPEKLNTTGVNNNSRIYSDFSSCNFSQAKKFFQCYLYTSSNNGDTFRLGYYKESDQAFVIFKKFREDRLIQERI